MEKILLSELAEVLKTECPIEAEITSISTDTREISENCLFIAIKGERFDAHDFIPEAIKSGAAAAVSEREIAGQPCLIVDSTRKALLDIAGFYRKRFTPFLVGITGSVGKTTTKEMIALVLSEKYETLKTQGNFNNEIGLPKTLFRLEKSHEAAVIEMGMSDFGEIERLSNTACPDMAVITNIGFSHIENLGSQEGILKAKLEILSGMSENSPLAVNGDDSYLSPLKQKLERPVYTFGIENEKCDFRGTEICESEDTTSFTVSYPGGKIRAEIPCIGRHNVMNALAAFSVGTLAGLSPKEIVSALKKYKSDKMRQNIVKKGENTIIIDCYNASPDSMKASLKVLSSVKTDGRKIAVLGDMLELGKQSAALHTLVGEYVSNAKIDKLFCFGHESKFIAQKAAESGIDSEFTENKDELTNYLKSYIKPGDTVLFKASRGMKLEEIIEKLF
ncbi:MAG: UDP-N-acetylmuramoyl-tripeptide--D-alanyl-D-alanine ligase [Oscillospiraceae bacterium]|nr:UDP-N-acetylmuramoyl-tripeptide--D-alanyl-D-alanine ligase [Oscillospiraceae bacterium]